MMVTFYGHTREPLGVGRSVSWSQMVGALSRFRAIRGSKADRLGSCPLWSPVRLSAPRRASLNVVEVSALVLDYDDGVALPEALGRWDGYTRAGYTTWSHQTHAPRCRVVLPLARAVPGAWWSALYRSLLDGPAVEADPQCLDPARAYYLPAEGMGGPHSATDIAGAMLDLWGDAEGLHVHGQRMAEERERHQRRRREDMRRRQCSTSERDRTAGALLATDAEARRRVAVDCGGQLLASTGGAEIARALRCPSCGRLSVWWAIPRGWARCNHANSCGWSGSVYDYARSW